MAEVLIPKDNNGRDMSPVEARTGIVLPIWAPGDGWTNRHHAHFYKRQYMNGPRKIETRAVRYSRLQRVLLSAHNGSPRAYHSQFEGTAFPRDEKQSFGIVILNCAGYIPPHVVDMTGSSAEIVGATDEMKQALRQPGVLGMENKKHARKRIGQFLMAHAVSQRFDHVKQSRIEQFLELCKPKYISDEEAQAKRLELGLRLSNIGLGVAVNPIDKTYFQARDEEALPEEAPVCAWQVAKDVVSGFEVDYLGDLEQNLTAQYAA